MDSQPQPSNAKMSRKIKDYLLPGSSKEVPRRTQFSWKKRRMGKEHQAGELELQELQPEEREADELQLQELQPEEHVAGEFQPQEQQAEKPEAYELQPSELHSGSESEESDDWPEEGGDSLMRLSPMDDICNSSSDDSESSSNASNDSMPVSPSHLIPSTNIDSIPVDTLKKVLLLVATQLRHNTTDVATVDFLKLINICSENEIPESNYFLKKCFGSITPAQIHHVCPKCAKYLTYIGEVKYLQCPSCADIVDLKANYEEGNFFLYLPLADQLRDIVENQSALFFKESPESVIPNNPAILTDIQDGLAYRKTKSNTSKSTQHLSLSFSCDGAPIFESSGYSMWPVLCTLNELPPELRKSNVMMASLWFGKNKPNMTEYLVPFVEESKSLHENGFNYTINNSVACCKVSVMVGVCDSAARPLLQNSTLHNGNYGCGFCVQPGETVAKGRGHCRVYDCEEGQTYENRNHEDTKCCMLEAADQGKPVFGMKGPSVLLDIPNFNIIDGLIPDYMHNTLLGVARQFMSIWVNGAFRDEHFYLGKKIKNIDKHLLKITPPINLSRTPRSINERANWKAHEWFNWLLYYSVPVLKGIMPEKYLAHWALLVEGIYILLKERILKSEIAHADALLRDFVIGTKVLYGLQQMSFNVHLLLHLAKSVVNWGPLWAHSAFVYENYNAELAAFVRSSNGVAHQISDRFLMKCALPKMSKKCLPYMTEKEKKILCELTERKKPRIKNSVEVGSGLTILGLPKISKAPRSHILAFHRNYINLGDQYLNYYARIVHKGFVIHSKSYTRFKKRNNHTVLLENGNVFSVEDFLHFNNNCYAIGNCFDVGRHDCCKNVKLKHILKLSKEENLSVINVIDIKEIVVFIEIAGNEISQYAVIQPTSQEVLQ